MKAKFSQCKQCGRQDGTFEGATCPHCAAFLKAQDKKYGKKETVTKEMPDPSLDITGDGKVDEADISLAGKVLSKTKVIRKRGANTK